MNEKELAAENERLRQEIEQLRRERDAANQTIKRAKDPNPISRPGFKRVIKLVADACMELVRVAGCWLLKFGRKERRFKRLLDIWHLFLADDWSLSDIFPEEGHKQCYSQPGVAPRVESLPPPPEQEMKKPVRAGQPPGISMKHLEAEWRMFPSARPAIQELLVKVGLPPGLFGEA